MILLLLLTEAFFTGQHLQDFDCDFSAKGRCDILLGVSTADFEFYGITFDSTAWHTPLCAQNHI